MDLEGLQQTKRSLHDYGSENKEGDTDGVPGDIDA